MTELTAAQLAQLGELLQQTQQDLRQQLQIGKQATDVVPLDQTLVGRVSRMDAMQQQNMAVSTRQKAEMKLRKIDLALKALHSGEYGYCRKCDEVIAFERLLAQPESTLCIQCQTLVDGQQ